MDIALNLPQNTFLTYRSYGNEMKDLICEAVMLYDDPMNIAKHIKLEADELYGPAHCCIVGNHFSG